MSGIAYHYTESNNMELILTRGEPRVYPWHMHMRHWTIGVICSGNALLTTAISSRRLHAGEHFFIPPYALHSLKVEPESRLCVVCCSNMNIFPDALPYCGTLLQPEEAMLLEATLSSCEKTAALLNAHHPPPGEGESLLRHSVYAVIRLMEDTPDTRLRTGQMAAHGGYSPWHFLRGFQKITGMTPHAFQLLCRLRLLRSMLRAGTASSITAVSAGFSDQSHMHKVFKHQHGITPKQFKQASFKLAL